MCSCCLIYQRIKTLFNIPKNKDNCLNHTKEDDYKNVEVTVVEVVTGYYDYKCDDRLSISVRQCCNSNIFQKISSFSISCTFFLFDKELTQT